MEKSCPARYDYPSCRGETTRPPELSLPLGRVVDPNVNGWSSLQRNKLLVALAGVTGGEGCLRYPRPQNDGRFNAWRFLSEGDLDKDLND